MTGARLLISANGAEYYGDAGAFVPEMAVRSQVTALQQEVQALEKKQKSLGSRVEIISGQIERERKKMKKDDNSAAYGPAGGKSQSERSQDKIKRLTAQLQDVQAELNEAVTKAAEIARKIQEGNRMLGIAEAPAAGAR